MINFQNTLTKLLLYDASGNLANNYPVFVQYYNTSDQEWVTLYNYTITKGGLYIERSIDEATTEETPYFDSLRAEEVPLLRIIHADPPAGSTLPRIVASTFAFNFYSDYLYEFDFGTLYLAPEVAVSAIAGRFKDFQPVASYYPVVLPGTEDPEETENPPVPIQDLYTNLVSEIASASQTSAGSPFKLSNISLKLKAVVHRDGESLSASLLDLENSENINGNAISELVFDITPVSERETAEATMPDVTGLTETAVRRILKTLGLKLNPVYQNKPTIVNGDSFKQSPAEGDSIQPNQLVTVIFSKHE